MALKRTVTGILSLTGILIVNLPLTQSACTPEVKSNGARCKNTLEAQSKITNHHLSSPDAKTTFCSDSLEVCIQNVETASKEKCAGINSSDVTYHAIVNALRGFCGDISVHQQYSYCIDDQQQAEIQTCDLAIYRNNSNFQRTQYDKGKYATEFDRKNAHCRVTRYAQMCYEDVTVRYCSDYTGHFRAYEIALLQPYCRQLLQLTSGYVGDDPNDASSFRGYSKEQLVGLSVAVLTALKLKS